MILARQGLKPAVDRLITTFETEAAGEKQQWH